MAPSEAWRHEGESLVRDLEFEDFEAAMAFVNRVAAALVEADHHPDILVHGWNKVRLTLAADSAGRLSDSDRGIAATIDEIVGPIARC